MGFGVVQLLVREAETRLFLQDPKGSIQEEKWGSFAEVGVQVRNSLDQTRVDFLVQVLGQHSLLAACQPCTHSGHCAALETLVHLLIDTPLKP